MQRLFPLPPGPVRVADAYGGPRPRHPDGRPWISLCMVASVDGATALDGRSAGLSGPADREVLLTLRQLVDMVIVGAGTVRTEGYGIPNKAGQRIGVVSRTGRVDPDAPLFASGAGFLILPEDAPPTPLESVRAGVGEIDLAAALCALPGDPATVQAEGGASLNGALAAAGVLDEINVTTSPLVVGGDAPRAVRGAPEAPRRYRLAHVLEDGGFLFSRYVAEPAPG